MEEKLIRAVSSFLIICDVSFLGHRDWSECAAAWKKVSEIPGKQQKIVLNNQQQLTCSLPISGFNEDTHLSKKAGLWTVSKRI